MDRAIGFSYMRHHGWTAYEDATLLALFQSKSYAEIAHVLHRHKATVRRRLRVLGFRRSVEVQRKLQSEKLRGCERDQLFSPHPRMLHPDADPLSSDGQDRWWKQQRAANKRFVELLKAERL